MCGAGGGGDGPNRTEDGIRQAVRGVPQGREIVGKIVNVGVGEIVDRLTVLALKIGTGEDRHQDTTHWRNEQTILVSAICGRTLNGSWFKLALDLAAVNGMLWHAEDDLRALRGQHRAETSPDSTGKTGEFSGPRILQQASTCAFRVQALNDQRTNLITEINKLTGDHLGPEKIV